MFAESQWHGSSVYGCQEKNNNNGAAEICQETLKDYQE